MKGAFLTPGVRKAPFIALSPLLPWVTGEARLAGRT
jgi:hypothetical protein